MWSAGPLIRGLLFNTGLTDAAAYAIAVALLASVAVVATYLPARRAVALDPAKALRAD